MFNFEELNVPTAQSSVDIDYLDEIEKRGPKTFFRVLFNFFRLPYFHTLKCRKKFHKIWG